MNITKFPPTHKPVQRFTAIPGSSRDFLFSTPKYNIEAAYASSNFYAPEFYRIKAMDKSSNVIWSGGDKLYVDSFFGEEFISDSFHKMILTQLNDTGNSSSCQIVLIDLLNGSEQLLAEEGAYGLCGHFQNFDGIFYTSAGEIHGINFETDKKFLLNPMLYTNFPNLKAWWLCPVKNCIVVISNTTENNIALFDIHEQHIVEQSALPLQTADSTNFSFVNLFNENALQISGSHAKRTESGSLMHSHTEWFRLEF